MCATEVYEFEIDNSDILYVYQYMLFKTMTRSKQKIGRILRSDQRQAYYVLLYSSWCEKSQNDRRIKNKKEKKKRSKKEDEENQRRDMSTELWSLINVNLKKCQRKLNNEHFVDDIYIKFDY